MTCIIDDSCKFKLNLQNLRCFGSVSALFWCWFYLFCPVFRKIRDNPPAIEIRRVYVTHTTPQTE